MEFEADWATSVWPLLGLAVCACLLQIVALHFGFIIVIPRPLNFILELLAPHEPQRRADIDEQTGAHE